jgi:hypothetical protein
MNRRKFIGGLLKGILTATIAPQVIVNSTTKWKRTGLIYHGEINLHSFESRIFHFVPSLQDVLLNSETIISHGNIEGEKIIPILYNRTSIKEIEPPDLKKVFNIK